MKQGFWKFSSIFSFLSPFLALLAYFYLFQTIIYVQYFTATLITIIITIFNTMRGPSYRKSYFQFVLLLLFNIVFIIQVFGTNDPGFGITMVPQFLLSLIIVLVFRTDPKFQSNSDNVISTIFVYLVATLTLIIALSGYVFGFIALDGGIN